jgi:nicotinamidase-related amidase
LNVAISLQSLLQPGRVAFLLCEVQGGVIGDGAPWPQLSDAARNVGLIGNAARLGDAARTRGAPVVHCTAEPLAKDFGGNRNARLFGNARKTRGGENHDPALDRPVAEVWRDGDLLLPRYHGVSPMTGTPLDSLLRNEGITTVILSGVSLSFAIINFTMDAVNRGYQVILPRDAVAGFPESYAQQVLDNTLSMLATITSTDEIIAAWAQ